MGGALEAQAVAGSQLSQPWQVHCRDHQRDRVATHGLVVGQEDDGRRTRQDLNGTSHHRQGDELAGLTARRGRPFE